MEEQNNEQIEIKEEEKILIDFSQQVLLIQQQLNQIKINNSPLKENGFYNEETKQAIMKLQEITDFTPNGEIDQNLMFRLNEIIENPADYNKNKTFAVLYRNYKNK